MTPPTWFFDSQARCNALRHELEGWRETPFSRSVGAEARKAIQCDCVSFVAAVLINLGAIKPFTWPRYVVMGGGRGMLETFVRTLASIPELERVHCLIPGDPLPPVRVGDLLLISGGEALHHLAIYAGDKTVWHATEPDRGVATLNLHDPLIHRHLLAVYRVRHDKLSRDIDGHCRSCNQPTP